MTKKISRNAPCPCGSGTKYKKCCLPSLEAARASARPPDPPFLVWHDDDLDDLSNSIVDLINDGNLDAAERACDELDRRFPEMIDCLDRRAMLLEARGQSKLAADYYRRAAEFARTNEGFDSITLDDFLARADRLDPSPAPDNP